MMAKAVTEARRPDAAAGADAIYRSLFDSFDRDKDGRISPLEVLSRLDRSGLRPDDPRIAEALTGLGGADGGSRHNSSLIRRAVEGNLAVPDFAALTADITRMYDELLPVRSGAVASYIPQLKRVGPEQLAIAVCTVDGQRFSVGDAATPFSLQSVSKTVSYCLALDEHGTEVVHQHVGREPSGRSFNELALNPQGLPHNPMVNAGGIMTCWPIRPEDNIADRFDLVAATWRRLAGGRRPGFNNAVYLSERQTADRNFALGYSMRESGAFRPGTDLVATLEFFFQCCSIEVDAQMLAVAAGSLAKAWVCPLTEDPVFTPGTVQSCLSLMSSCGMYDFSGEFAFTIGLPAKSGVSGAIMLVVPGLMGICVWSPRLDEHGNSVRGIEFCRQLVAAYTVHAFDSLVTGTKRDPRRKKNQTQTEAVVALTWAASQGDLTEVRALIATGVEPGTADYDGRTPLHLAAAEGQLKVVRYLLAAGADPRPKDRWGGTPLSDAEGNGHAEIAALLREHAAQVAPFRTATTSERRPRYERQRRCRHQGGRGPARRRLAPDRPRLVPDRPTELRSGSRSWHARLPLRGGRRRQPVSADRAGRPAGQHHRGPAGHPGRAAPRPPGPGPGRAQRSPGGSQRPAAGWCGPLGGGGITASIMSTSTTAARPARDFRPDWRDDAACRKADPELFFPDVDLRSAARAQLKTAKLICRGCPVSAMCLSWALASGQEAGIWGGLTEDERRRLHRRGRDFRPATDSPCEERHDQNPG